MPRVVFAPKFATETRGDRLDYSPYIQPGSGGSLPTITAVVTSITVWTGVDPGISLTATPSILSASAGTVLNLLSGGTLGVIYQVTVRATFSDGTVIPLSYYLAIVPDAP